MNDELLTTLGDHELRQLIVRAQTELAVRTRKHKEDTIAKIKALAGAAGVEVSIKGTRGRPPTRNSSAKPTRSAQAK